MASSARTTCSYHPETDSGDYDDARHGSNRTGPNGLPTLELSGKCDSRLAHPAQFGYQSWLCKGAGGELRTGQAANGGARARPSSGTVGTNQSRTLDRSLGPGSTSPRAGSCLCTARTGTLVTRHRLTTH